VEDAQVPAGRRHNADVVELRSLRRGPGILEPHPLQRLRRAAAEQPRQTPALREGPARRDVLRVYAEQARELLEGQPDRTTTVTRLAMTLLKDPRFREDTKTAGVQQKSVMAGFLGAFPEWFRMTTPRTGGAATVRLLHV
jgi:hypothetical protein